MKVATTANTRLMMGRGEPAKVSDVKVGDGVLAMGNLDAPNKTLHAAMMFATPAEELKKLKENLGKTYITGKVTAIDADGVSQTIGLDEGTSFKRGGRGMRMGNGMGAIMIQGGNPQVGAAAAAGGGGESITLADVKIGDSVVGQGSLKSGVFVPGQLNVVGQRTRGEGRPTAQNGPSAGTAKPQ